MVKVTFYNLLRSKYRINEVNVNAGTVKEIINQIIETYPQIARDDLMQSVLFINQEKVMHLNRLDEIVEEGDDIVFTNFVGGG
ncbi:MAG: MoaD/ThiS family protein [Candidatus Izemoplasmataceae bacterium]|uniref:MoaD/ThiS family protein n=1 Tax=Liberiplasma polymorphum TaxID=3374570 RepID=UPI0037726D69